MSSAKLLVIDDDLDLSELTARRAREHGFATTLCPDGRNVGAELIADVDVILLDMVMPECDGVQVMRRLADLDCKARIVLCSSLGDSVLSSAAVLGRRLGLDVVETLVKPYSRQNLVSAISLARTSPGTRPRPASDATQPAVDLDAGELLVLFQPKIELSTLDFTAVEALARWRHPTRGLIGPAAFIPDAEREGRIDEITLAVFEQSLAQAARWLRDGMLLKLSVNLSTRLLGDRELPDRLAEAAERHGVGPEQIVLEVTETWLHVDRSAALESLTRLRIKGFELSIDDFGTGYASLSHLGQFPFSEMKIDRSFVSQAPYNDQALHILQTSIELGHRLGLNVVAEGVENQDQWDLITELGCDECQGFFISRPLHGGDAPAWLKRWQAIRGSALQNAALPIAS